MTAFLETACSLFREYVNILISSASSGEYFVKTKARIVPLKFLVSLCLPHCSVAAQEHTPSKTFIPHTTFRNRRIVAFIEPQRDVPLSHGIHPTQKNLLVPLRSQRMFPDVLNESHLLAMESPSPTECTTQSLNTYNIMHPLCTK